MTRCPCCGRRVTTHGWLYAGLLYCSLMCANTAQNEARRNRKLALDK